ncbi:hypothetical protein ACRW9N_13315 [Listeria aquatica]|uniref:hypothetical protein n=1 Tax=Listeria aquatica TaxID=1494960 RepID=UPI003EF4725B
MKYLDGIKKSKEYLRLTKLINKELFKICADNVSTKKLLKLVDDREQYVAESAEMLERQWRN